MIAGLAALNLVLFQRDGLDLYLPLILAGAVPCFLYQRFAGVMRIVKWLWVLLTLPYWLLAGYLLFQMAAAVWLQAGAKPIPPKLLVRADFTPEQARNLQILREKYGKIAALGSPVGQLYEAWRIGLSRPESMERFLMDPATEAIMEGAAPILDEYMAVSLAAPANLRSAATDNEIATARTQFYMAQLVRRDWLYRHGRLPEAQRLYLLQLRADLQQLSFPQGPEPTLAAISNSMRIVRYQQDYYPNLTQGIEPETLALVQQLQARLREAAADAFGPAEFTRFQQELDLWRHDNEYYRRQADYLPVLQRGIVRRLHHWPLLVRSATFGEYAGELAEMGATLKMDPVTARQRMDEMVNSSWTVFLSPNLGGFLAIRVVGRNYTLTPLLIPTESALKAYAYSLRWQLRTEPKDAASLLDPASGAPFIIRETLFTSGEQTLVIAGGGQPRFISKTDPTQKRLGDLGITNAIYIFQATRPVTGSP